MSSIPPISEVFDSFLQRFSERVKEGARSADTLEMHRTHVRFLLEHIDPSTPVDLVDEQTVETWLAAEKVGRREFAGGPRPLGNGSLRKRASTLRSALELARRAKWIHRVPDFPEMPHRYEPDPRYLPTWDDYQEILDALPEHRREWLALALWTGQRKRDVNGMRREDFDPACPDALGGPWVRVRSRKTSRRRGIRIAAAPELVRILTPRWLRLRASAPLVEPWEHVSSQLAATCRRIGKDAICANTLRHTFFTWAVAANGITAEIQAIGQWTTPFMLLTVYAHAMPVRFHRQVVATDELARSLMRTRVLSGNDAGPKENPPGAGTPGGQKTATLEGSDRGWVGAQGIEPRTNGLRVLSESPRRPPRRAPVPEGVVARGDEDGQQTEERGRPSRRAGRNAGSK